jgi:four helix bundle protein
MPRSHRDLIVWQKAMALAVESYCLVKRLPTSERFLLGAQIRDAASSIPMNIAEGKGRRGRAEYAQFLSNARASTAELDTGFELAVRLAFVSVEEVAKARALMDEVGRMLTAMMRRLRPFDP